MEKSVEERAADLVDALRNRGLYIVTVESCTGGGLANAITDVPGASDVFEAGFVAYSNEQKIQLGVPPRIISRHTVYSGQTAEAMAYAGMRAAVRANVGVGITGSLTRVDPSNAEASQPGTVYVVAVFDGCGVQETVLVKNEGSRAEQKKQVVSAALRIARQVINDAC